MNLAAAIRTIPDFPKKGIMFRDITTLLADEKAFRYAVDAIVEPFKKAQIQKHAGNEAGPRFHSGGRHRPPIGLRLCPRPKSGKAAA